MGDRKWTSLLLLGCGVLFLVLSQVRYGVGWFAWVTPVPFILYLNRTRGRMSRLVLMLTLIFAWAIASAKYIMPPLPYFLILLNGISYGLVNGVGYLAWDTLRKQLPKTLANLGFGAIFVALEWLQHSFTPLASNGAVAYTQLENLPFLQLTALFGIAGPCFVINWFAAILADQLHEKRLFTGQFVISVSVICLVHMGGAFRIGAPAKASTVRVAAVGTDCTWFGGPLPSKAETLKTNQALFERTVAAAKAGAKMVVWNEVATIIMPEDEPDFLAEARQISAAHNLHLVTSYLVPKRIDPLLVENKFTWIGPNGDIIDMYLKSKPLPGEPSIPGDGNAKLIETSFGRVTGAICYEIDFPNTGLAFSKRGADFVFVPSSDTASVDPFHTQVAALRAIEGGYSILRSTRFGLSAGIGPRGRIRGWMSANETDDKIMLVTLPHEAVGTLYRSIGDLLAYVSLGYLGFLVLARLKSKRD